MVTFKYRRLIVTKKTKTILGIIATVLFIGSLALNIFIFSRYNKIKTKVTNIVDEKIDNVQTIIVEKNEELNKEYESTITELESSFQAPQVVYKNMEPLVDEDGRTYVISTVNGEDYKFYLADNVEESQQQVVFYADRLNFVTKQYETEVQKRNEMIDELEFQLETAKRELKRDLTDAEMQQLVHNIKTKFFRFGIDVWVGGTLPLTQLIKDGKVDRWGYFSGGLGANFLFMEKVNVRFSIGMEQQIDNTLNPIVGIAIGWYF